MTTADGRIIGTTQIFGTAPRPRAFNVVLLAEGFRETEQDAFDLATGGFVDALMGVAPFDGLASGINVFRVNVASTDSGADDPVSGGGTGASAHTYFDATFGSGGLRRLLVCSQATALSVAATQVPEFTVCVVVVNSTIYGGSGGGVAVYSLAGGATEIALHEIGHTAFGLADEYEYYQGCGVDTDRNTHLPFEPIQPNVTINTDRSTLKWRNLVAATTAVPTTRNADCSRCDPQLSPVPDGTIGAFEGAHYYHCGAFRPAFRCRMRQLGAPFCGVCGAVISARIALPSRPAMFQNRVNNAYELVAREGDQLRHYWFNYGGDFAWHRASQFGADVRSTPASFQNRANNAYEVVIQEGSRLRHHWFDYGGDLSWHSGQQFGTDVRSAPVMFQDAVSDAYEVVVQEGDHLRHYWFGYGGDFVWHSGQQFGVGVSSTPSLFQNRVNNAYELVVQEGSQLQHYWFDYGGDLSWHLGQQFGTDVRSAPASFQNRANDAYELVVREGGQLRHYWFDYGGDFAWHVGQRFGTDVRSTPVMFQNVANDAYEVVVQEGDRLRHYWFDYGGDRLWHSGQTFGTDIRAAPTMFQNTANWAYEVVVQEGDHLQHFWFDYGGDLVWHRGLSIP